MTLSHIPGKWKFLDGKYRIFFSRNWLFTWLKHFKHGVRICTYHMLMVQNLTWYGQYVLSSRLESDHLLWAVTCPKASHFGWSLQGCSTVITENTADYVILKKYWKQRCSKFRSVEHHYQEWKSRGLNIIRWLSRVRDNANKLIEKLRESQVRLYV